MIANNGALPLDAVENKFRAHVFAMRIRLVDLFAHFDKLRSGFITASQFLRCIGAAYDKGVVTPLTQAECDILVSHYDVKKNGMVKWRAFADSIDKGAFYSFLSGSILVDRLLKKTIVLIGASHNSLWCYETRADANKVHP